MFYVILFHVSFSCTYICFKFYPFLHPWVLPSKHVKFLFYLTFKLHTLKFSHKLICFQTTPYSTPKHPFIYPLIYQPFALSQALKCPQMPSNLPPNYTLFVHSNTPKFCPKNRSLVHPQRLLQTTPNYILPMPSNTPKLYPNFNLKTPPNFAPHFYYQISIKHSWMEPSNTPQSWKQKNKKTQIQCDITKKKQKA